MSPDEASRFNFLEAGARVLLAYRTGEAQHCIKPRAPSWRAGEEKNVFLVRYKQGDFYIVAHVTERWVLFKHQATRKNLSYVMIDKVEEYLKTRFLSEPPPLLLVYSSRKKIAA